MKYSGNCLRDSHVGHRKFQLIEPRREPIQRRRKLLCSVTSMYELGNSLLLDEKMESYVNQRIIGLITMSNLQAVKRKEERRRAL